MGCPVPTRYSGQGSSFAFTAIRRKMGERLRGPVRTRLLELIVFGPLWGLIAREIVVHALRSRLNLLEAHFQARFYVRQYAQGVRRIRVERAPLLHYVLVGWREGRSPSPDFDPIFYRQSQPHSDCGGDPLFHYVTIGQHARAQRHECDQVGDHHGCGDAEEAVLTINHARGGGSARFLQLFEEQLRLEGRNVLRLRAVNNAPTLGVIHDRSGPGTAAEAHVFDLATERADLGIFAQQRRVRRLLLNHWVDRPVEMMDWVRDLADRLTCSYDVVLHDYYSVCPRINLVDGEGLFCGLPPASVCGNCVRRDGAEVPVGPESWRNAVRHFLAGADRLIVPSHDCADRLRPFLPRDAMVWEPESDEMLPPERGTRILDNEPLRVAILGALNVPKGLFVVRELAERARRTQAPLRFMVIGPASDPEALRKVGVSVSGPYASSEMDRLLASSDPHLVFLPAVWPETWSFVLTTALRHALPVAAFARGAPAERLRRLGRGILLPTEWIGRPDEVLQAFLSLRQRWIQR